MEKENNNYEEECEKECLPYSAETSRLIGCKDLCSDKQDDSGLRKRLLSGGDFSTLETFGR